MLHRIVESVLPQIWITQYNTTLISILHLTLNNIWMDSKYIFKYTGKSNSKSLHNLHNLEVSGPQLWLVPGQHKHLI